MEYRSKLYTNFKRMQVATPAGLTTSRYMSSSEDIKVGELVNPTYQVGPKKRNVAIHTNTPSYNIFYFNTS
jgi:hypothetical protein